MLIKLNLSILLLLFIKVDCYQIGKISILNKHHDIKSQNFYSNIQLSSKKEVSVENTDIVNLNTSNLSIVGKIKASSNILYKFSRPHTIKVDIVYISK